jgi:hydroxysqualene synthase
MVTSLDAAYETCARLARGHYENFPVASRLLPRPMRPHIAAVYAFARTADDFADEGHRPAGERLRLLDEWGRWLSACEGLAAGASSRVPVPAEEGLPAETPHIFAALGDTIRSCGLSRTPFEDLLSAFRQDVTTVRYAGWDDVLDYCRRSANPVGRLVLAIAGYRGERVERSSDALCTALQLTNFWQDFEGDWQKGRLYLPLDECRRAGAETGDLDARQATPAWRQVVGQAAGRTVELFERGRGVCDAVSGRLKWELRVTWLGGRRILERLEQNDYDVFGGRPVLGAGDVPALLWQAISWRAR